MEKGSYKGHVAALVRSHMNDLKPFERTMERTTETVLPSPKAITGVAMTTYRITSLRERLHYRIITNLLMIYYISSFRDYTLSSGLHDNGWHHLCLTWKNTDGRASMFIDGTMLMSVDDYQTGQTIAGNGKFILGQEQDSLGTVADGFICY